MFAFGDHESGCKQAFKRAVVCAFANVMVASALQMARLSMSL
jgi:hypothetical protein